MRRVQLLVVATVVCGFGVMPHVSQAQPPGQPVRQVVGNGTASIDVFAQDATVDLLTTQRNGGDLQLHHQRSVDGGETWGLVRVIDTTTKPISIASRGNEPQIVAYRDHIAVHWSTKGAARFGAGPMVTAVSDDAGRTWRLGPNPADDDSGGAQNFADMTADADGTFYVAWIGSHDGPAGRSLGRPGSRASWSITRVAPVAGTGWSPLGPERSRCFTVTTAFVTWRSRQPTMPGPTGRSTALWARSIGSFRGARTLVVVWRSLGIMRALSNSMRWSGPDTINDTASTGYGRETPASPGPRRCAWAASWHVTPTSVVRGRQCWRPGMKRAASGFRSLAISAISGVSLVRYRVKTWRPHTQ